MLNSLYISIAEDVPSGGLPVWAQILIALIGLLGIITKQLVPGWVYQEKVTELNAQKVENARVTNLLLEAQQTTLPALTEATGAVKDSISSQREIMAELRVLRQRG